MLTVKHVSENGDELVIQALRISTTKNPRGGKQPIQVIVTEPNGHIEHYESGTVYVMNDNGATVSQWMIISSEETDKILESARNFKAAKTRGLL